MSKPEFDSVVIVHKEGKLCRSIGRVVKISDPEIAKRTDAVAVYMLTGDRAYTSVVIPMDWATDGSRVCYLCKHKDPMNDRDHVRCKFNGIIPGYYTCNQFQPRAEGKL